VLEVVVDGDDVRVVERTAQPGLSQEPLGEQAVAGMELRQLLEGYLASQVDLTGEVHDRGAAATDLPIDLIPPDLPSDVH